ncbi:MAG: aromatic amino acid ammonia-lyase [Leptospiraceae bacterium]|nr:aromatic amino acid ammonia-lyase [Leptospiraceae bacterium]MDW8306693.1 aromatic amino acid ammonia-lyase [Leptospiraceae bacterium]
MSAVEQVEIGFGAHLEIFELEKIAQSPKIELSFSPQTPLALEKSYVLYQRALHQKIPIYGTHTGYGALVDYSSGGEEEQARNLLEHLACGSGCVVEREIAQLTLILRLHNVCQGYSGITPDLPEKFVPFLQEGLIPQIPELGSLGASGDLIPLSHLFRTFQGRGFFYGYEKDACQVMRDLSLQKIDYSSRDALALVNGISFSCAILALAAIRGRRLILFAEKLTAALYSLLGARRSALDPRYHQVRQHEGQKQSAAFILEHTLGIENSSRSLQEVYSLRCAPQILGAARGELSHILRIVEEEVNGVSDNPLFFEERDGQVAVVHGGNFFGQNLAFAADRLNALLTQTGILAERQLFYLLNPASSQAPAMLAFEPGRESALAGAQLLATALVAEMRSLCYPHATLSIPTNTHNQDIVPMAALASRRALQQTDLLAKILAILNIALNQYYHLAQAGLCHLGCEKFPPYLYGYPPIKESRALNEDIENLARKILFSS